MLSIGKLALGQQRYYEQSVAQGQDDYYSGRGEAPGEWTGSGAGELGLRGRVSAGQFNALLEGADPRDMGERLRAGNSEPSIAAFDLTFSAPKSVSVLFAVAPGEVSAQLVAAHEDAVRAALSYLEREAVFVRRGKGGFVFEHAGGLIAAAYRHRMSRALDPQLHTHVVAANLSRGLDGRYTALHHPSLYRAARTAGYLYQSHLRAEVRDRLGLEWGPVHKGAAELEALPADVLRAFSQRRAQIEVVIADREQELGRSLTRSEREHWGAIATRDRKQYGIETHTWREEVSARAAEHGLGREQVELVIADGVERAGLGELTREGQLEVGGKRVREDVLAGRLAGPAGLTEGANTFEVGAVVREFTAAAAQGSRAGTVEAQVERFVGRADALATTRGMFTTADLVERERALIAAAVDRAGAQVALLPASVVDEVLSGSERSLNPDQAGAVRVVAGSGNGVDVIEALAGTGKTYTAAVLREVYERAGYTVVGVAPTARGARELSEQAGISSRTLDSRVLAINSGRGLPPGSVVIFDEAGMAATRLSEQLLANAAKVGAKVVAIGDPGQLASVQAGGWLGAVGERVGTVRLSEVMRQRDRLERLALAGLHDGDPARWIEWAARHQRLEVLDSARELLERAVSEWLDGAVRHGVAESVMVCRENETRHALNQLARHELGALGRLGEEHAYGPVTVAVGDRVICRNNERDLDVDNGTRGTVRVVQASGIVIETDAHLVRDLPAGYVSEHVEHAYALTGHGMQGGTVEQAVVVARPHELTRGWSYTALSRARGQTRLLIDGSERELGGREEIAPGRKQPVVERDRTLASVAAQMRVRDDEDLAIDQLVAGRPDDPQLGRAPVEPLQQETAPPGERSREHTGRSDLHELREQLERLRAQLASLPTRELAQLEDLELRTRELTERRDVLRERLAQLPEPRERRFTRFEDPQLVERTRVRSALAGAEDQLERALSEHATLNRALGNPHTVRQEREGLSTAIERLEREHSQQLDRHVERELAAPPRWAREALGERPEQRRDAERWDRAVEQIARYRIQYEIPQSGQLLGEPPSREPQQRDYERVNRAREQLARELERPGHEHER